MQRTRSTTYGKDLTVPRGLRPDSPRSQRDAESIERSPAVEQHTRAVGVGVAAGFVVLCAIALVLVIVVTQNSDSVRFEFLWWDAMLPVAVIVLVTALVTLVLDEAIGLSWRRRRRRARGLSGR